MKLYLIRHAKTDQKSSTGLDFDRELLPRGVAQSKDLRAYIESIDVSVGTVLCSTARRTRQTFYHVRGAKEDSVRFLDTLYLADRQTLLKEITRVEHNSDLMLIGHNDGITELAEYLTGADIYLKTGMLCILHFNGACWAELSAETATVEGFYRSECR
ncbi:MAG: hypothetical protein RIT43_2456 [Bacteroidota bacterium]|jgi:phosphohistidine phosphatase